MGYESRLRALEGRYPPRHPEHAGDITEDRDMRGWCEGMGPEYMEEFLPTIGDPGLRAELERLAAAVFGGPDWRIDGHEGWYLEGPPGAKQWRHGRYGTKWRVQA